MTRDPSAVEPSLVELVRELSRRAGRPAEELEVRAALAPLAREEQARLQRWSQGEPPARPLGPMAWADLARGIAPAVAAARETSGFYALQAERDTLAALLLAREGGGTPETAPAPVSAATSPAGPPQAAPAPRTRAARAPAPAAPAEEAPPEPAPDGPRARKRQESAPQQARAEQLLTLFAYHRDPPLVARALQLTLAQLDEEIERLKLRRQTRRLLRGTDADLPMATPGKGPSGPPVRRRAAGARAATKVAEPVGTAALATEPATPAAPPAKGALRAAEAGRPAPEPELPAAQARGRIPARPSPGQAAELKAVLREVGPRRKLLAERLGSGGTPLSAAGLLARFRAAGLEREFGQRERDLVRALLSKHKAAFGPAATELGLARAGLAEVIRERGLAREVEGLRDRERRAARGARWPQARIELVLHQRERLADLGVLEELDKEVQARVTLLWGELGKAGGASPEKLARALHLPAPDARLLVERLGLR